MDTKIENRMKRGRQSVDIAYLWLAGKEGMKQNMKTMSHVSFRENAEP